MVTGTSTKERLRQEMRERLGRIEEGERRRWSAEACRRIAALEEFQRALVVMLYLPLHDEVNVSNLALNAFQAGKTVCAPRMDWEHGRMRPVEIEAFDSDRFEVRKHGVREPIERRPVPLEDLNFILTPGLAFAVTGARLGRGGGFYDRFLASLPTENRATTCGACFEAQIVPDAAELSHDVRVDLIATPERIVDAHTGGSRGDSDHPGDPADASTCGRVK